MATDPPTDEMLKDPSMYTYTPDAKARDPIEGNLQEVYVTTNSAVKFTSLKKALKAAETD